MKQYGQDAIVYLPKLEWKEELGLARSAKIFIF